MKALPSPWPNSSTMWLCIYRSSILPVLGTAHASDQSGLMCHRLIYAYAASQKLQAYKYKNRRKIRHGAYWVAPCDARFTKQIAEFVCLIRSPEASWKRPAPSIQIQGHASPFGLYYRTYNVDGRRVIVSVWTAESRDTPIETAGDSIMHTPYSYVFFP